MEKLICQTCLDSKTTLRCGLCEEASCKTCSHLLDEDAFSFLPKVPEHLTKGVYCATCYNQQVAAEAEDYERTMEAARNIDVFFKDQGKETRLIRREADPYIITECSDRDELVMRFAFRAVRDGYNTIIEVDVVAEKTRDGGFQSTNYRGSAIPANARAEHIIRDKSFRHNPN